MDPYYVIKHGDLYVGEAWGALVSDRRDAWLFGCNGDAADMIDSLPFEPRDLRVVRVVQK